MGILRWIAQSISIVLFIALVPLSILTVWIRSEVRDTDQFVRTVGPLASEPAVQRQVAIAVMAYLDRAADGLENLSPTARRALQTGYAGARPTIERTVDAIVASDTF